MERPMHRDHALGMLGLRDASPLTAAAIKKAHHEKAKMWHPDLQDVNNDPQKAAMAPLMMRKINEARDFLLKDLGKKTPYQQGSMSFEGSGSISIPMSDEQFIYLNEICTLMGLSQTPENHDLVFQFATQLMGKLIQESYDSLFGVCVGNKRSRYKTLNLRDHMLKAVMVTPSQQRTKTVSKAVGRHMTDTLSYMNDGEPLPPVVVVNAIAHVLEPLWLILHAEINKGLDVAIHRVFYYQKFETPVCVHFWLELNPGKTEADAYRALKLRKGFFGRLWG